MRGGQYIVPNLEETLQRLAHTFTVSDIMVPIEKLTYASSEAKAGELLELIPDFDVIPIVRRGTLCAYLERGFDHSRDIRPYDIVCDATSILDLVDILEDRKFCFIMVSNRIAGYIHFSDLNNHLVKLPYFIILEAVERHLVEKIDTLITQDTLEKVLPEKFEAIKERMRRQKNNRTELGWVSLLFFDEIVRCSCYFEMVQLEQEEINTISKTRNCVYHARRVLIGRHEDVKRLAKARRICISLLAGPKI